MQSSVTLCSTHVQSYNLINHPASDSNRLCSRYKIKRKKLPYLPLKPVSDKNQHVPSKKKVAKIKTKKVEGMIDSFLYISYQKDISISSSCILSVFTRSKKEAARDIQSKFSTSPTLYFCFVCEYIHKRKIKIKRVKSFPTRCNYYM